MFAVVSAGGRQYKVHEGDVLRIEKVTHEPGQQIELKPLLISDNDQMELSADQLAKYQIVAKVLRTAKAKKIVVFTYRNKTNEHRRKGHRQFFSEVRIEKISRR